MAYNVLKGIVEGSVDQYGDQQIEGIKVFKSTISASVFYDTDAESPCATLKDVALTELKGSRRHGILTYAGKTTAKTEFDLYYEKNTLHAKNIKAGEIEGSATGLRQIPPDRFAGKISPSALKLSHGLEDMRGSLRVNDGAGIAVSDKGVEVALANHSGLDFTNEKLTVDPHSCLDITTDGQNLSDKDMLLVHDESKNALRRTTLTNLCDSYLKIKLPRAQGPEGSLQIKGTKGFAGSSELAYDSKNKTLKVGGTVVAQAVKTLSDLEVKGTLTSHGAVVRHLTVTTDHTYEVKPDDYTVLCDTHKNAIVVSLPPARDNAGRVLLFKKINSDSYRLTSHRLSIKVEEGKLDISDTVELKMVFSTVMFQSDGRKWWIIGKSGS